MNIGDRVRVVHGREEGIITKLVDNLSVMVAIDNDFEIPMLKSELVLVSESERSISQTGDVIPLSKSTDTLSSVGIYLALMPVKDNRLELYVLNNSELKLFYAISEKSASEYKGLYSGILQRKKYDFLATFRTTDFDSGKKLSIQYFLHDSCSMHELVSAIADISIKSNSFLKNKYKAPLLLQDAFLFRLDEKAEKITAEEVIEKMFEDKKNTSKPLPKPADSLEFDLHIEVLTPYHLQLLPGEKLKLQLDIFEKELANAIAVGAEEITFIHGVGAGVLKKEIANLLSKNKQIQFFQDARKDKFGYGATLVKLK